MKKVLLFGLFLLPIYHCEAQTSNAAPYCKPIFQNTAPNNYINSLDFFGTVNNTGSTNPGYTFFNNIAPAQLTAYNGIAPLILGVASLYANGGVSTPANYIQVYVDYNHNNVFDYYEGIGQSFGNAGAYASIYCRNPTDTALYGITRLRVVWSNDPQSDPCNSVSSFVYNGEVEDYLVRVVGTFPIANPKAATNLTKSTATLNGTVNVNGVNAVATAFEYGQTTAYTNEVPGTSLLADTTGVSHPVTANISGLLATTIYHFRVKAFNGTDTVFSKDQTFVTNNLPSAVTALSATSSVKIFRADHNSIIVDGLKTNKSYAIKLYDLNGKTIFNGVVGNGQKVDFESYSSGIYVVEITNTSDNETVLRDKLLF